MNNREKAIEIANLPWTRIVTTDTLSDGEEVFIGDVIGLPKTMSCMVQEKSEGKAWAVLQTTFVDFIEVALDDGMDFPRPPYAKAISWSLG